MIEDSRTESANAARKRSGGRSCIEVRDNASASDVLGLIEDARERVAQRFGLRLECEVVVWRRPAGDG